VYRSLAPVVSTVHAILTIDGAAPVAGATVSGTRFVLGLNSGATWTVCIYDPHCTDTSCSNYVQSMVRLVLGARPCLWRPFKRLGAGGAFQPQVQQDIWRRPVAVLDRKLWTVLATCCHPHSTSSLVYVVIRHTGGRAQLTSLTWCPTHQSHVPCS
jgi:hypothetical protein